MCFFSPSSKTHTDAAAIGNSLVCVFSNIPQTPDFHFCFQLNNPTSTFYAAILSPLPFVSKFGIGNCFDLRPPTAAPLSFGP
jgi:hypothetical protein